MKYEWLTLLIRLGVLDSSTPHSPHYNLTRTRSSPSMSEPDQFSSATGDSFPAPTTAPLLAETSAVSAIGQNGRVMEDGEYVERARRELSSIEERDTSSIAPLESAVTQVAEEEEADARPLMEASEASAEMPEVDQSGGGSVRSLSGSDDISQ